MGCLIKRLPICLALMVLGVGCHLFRPRATPTAKQPEAVTGGSATNVMIVPASAGWAARRGPTNRLPAGIVTRQIFPFPDYDDTLVKAVYGRWQDLLKARTQPAGQGVVVVEFELHADGSVSRVRTFPSQVSPRLEQLCEQAITESAPFAKWPAPMRDEIGAEVRSIRISFDFNA